jgi:hypothetical protein
VKVAASLMIAFASVSGEHSVPTLAALIAEHFLKVAPTAERPEIGNAQSPLRQCQHSSLAILGAK